MSTLGWAAIGLVVSVIALVGGSLFVVGIFKGDWTAAIVGLVLMCLLGWLLRDRKA